jgi:hypothetical protein
MEIQMVNDEPINLNTEGTPTNRRSPDDELAIKWALPPREAKSTPPPVEAVRHSAFDVDWADDDDEF